MSSAQLELHKGMVAYCSVLQAQEEVMLCGLCSWSLHCSVWPLCDSLGWFPSPLPLLVSWLSPGSRQEAALTQAASDPHRLQSSVAFNRKRAALWGQKLYFPHDMVCSEESAHLSC